MVNELQQRTYIIAQDDLSLISGDEDLSSTRCLGLCGTHDSRSLCDTYYVSLNLKRGTYTISYMILNQLHTLHTQPRQLILVNGSFFKTADFIHFTTVLSQLILLVLFVLGRSTFSLGTTYLDQETCILLTHRKKCTKTIPVLRIHVHSTHSFHHMKLKLKVREQHAVMGG